MAVPMLSTGERTDRTCNKLVDKKDDHNFLQA